MPAQLGEGDWKELACGSERRTSIGDLKRISEHSVPGLGVVGEVFRAGVQGMPSSMTASVILAEYCAERCADFAGRDLNLVALREHSLQA